MVIGYMNTRTKGPEGRSMANGDKRDIYRIDALGGEVINLIINDPSQADLDLYLQNAEGETLMTSVGSSPFESLRSTQPRGELLSASSVLRRRRVRLQPQHWRRCERNARQWAARQRLCGGAKRSAAVRPRVAQRPF